MATPDVRRTLRQNAIWLGVAFVATSCAESQSPPPRTVVAQEQLTAAEVTNVQFRMPPGYGDRSPPPMVATPLQRQMEDDQKYPVPSVETAGEWGARYPFPAKMLGDWTRNHPRAVEPLLRWEDEQPDHLRMLVRWAIANPYDGIGSFMINRRGWEDLRAIRDSDPAGVDALLSWCRAAPKAAEELVMHSEGFGRVISLNTPPK